MFKFCPNCGKELKGAFKFCPFCGFKFPETENVSDIRKTESNKSTEKESVHEEPLDVQKAALVLILKGRFEEADALLRKAINDDPSNLDLNIALLRSKSKNYTVYISPETSDALHCVEVVSNVTHEKSSDPEYLDFLKRRKDALERERKEKALEEKRLEKERKRQEELERRRRMREEEARLEKERREALKQKEQDELAAIYKKYHGFFNDVGVVEFGTYLTTSLKKEPIKWVVHRNVITREVMLLSFMIDARPYGSYVNNLQDYLNREFYNKAFSEMEKKIIIPKKGCYVHVPTLSEVRSGYSNNNVTTTAINSGLKKIQVAKKEGGFDWQYPFWVDDDGYDRYKTAYVGDSFYYRSDTELMDIGNSSVGVVACIYVRYL